MADAFAAAGATVALAARTEAAIDELAERHGGRAYPLDAADPAQVEGFIERVEADGGPIDILVNNAGVETTDLIEDIDEAAISRTIEINLTTPQRLTKQVISGMIERDRGTSCTRHRPRRRHRHPAWRSTAPRRPGSPDSAKRSASS